MFIRMIAYSFNKGGAAHSVALLSDQLSGLGHKVEKVDAFGNGLGKILHLLKLITANLILLAFYKKPKSGMKRSLGLFSSANIRCALKKPENKNCITNIHWIGNEGISCHTLKEIPEHSIISLHDEYIMNGVDHYARDEISKGYLGNKIDALICNIKRANLHHRSDLTFTVSSWHMKKCLEKSRVLSGFSGTVCVIPTPIDLKTFAGQYKHRNYDDGSTKIKVAFGFSGGSSNYIKGSDIFFDSLKILSRLFPETLEVHLYGTIKAPSHLRNFIDHGFLSQSQLSRLFGTVDIVVSASRSEAYGQIVPEAMAAGAATLVSNTTGSVDFIPADLKWLIFENGNAKDLASKIYSYSKLQQSERAVLSHKVHKAAVEFCSVDNTTQKFNQLFEKIYRRM